jgi:hypothetical protein
MGLIDCPQGTISTNRPWLEAARARAEAMLCWMLFTPRLATA